MFDRVVSLPRNRSFFLFGARGTGKSTLLKRVFAKRQTLWFDLLDLDIEDRLLTRPMRLEEEVLGAKRSDFDWIVIDEIQKIPKLLDVVHRLIENHSLKFALTGSSARKLKRGSANLLAGRALHKVLFPLTYRELGEQFSLDFCLRWGSLPEVFSLDTEERKDYLRTYAHSYVKEEIQAEQILRKIPPFKKFLEIAAASNGKIINFSKIARDIGSDPVSVKSYFEILEETLLGFFLPAYDTSIRKQQSKAPKFYFFDLGVCRALARRLSLPIQPSTYEYGNAFEQFIINEVHRMNLYQQKDWNCSYFRSKDGAEIDLILERPGQATLLVEIKSKKEVAPEDLKHLKRFAQDFPDSETVCLSLDPIPQKIGSIRCLHWKEGLTELSN